MVDLRQGDCLEIMKDIESGSVDMVLTDLPYGTTECKWDSVILFDKMWEQLNRVIKPNRAIVLFGSEPFSSALRMSNIKSYKYDWKWDKKKPSTGFHAKIMPLKDYEDILVFNAKGTYYPVMNTAKVRNDKARLTKSGDTFRKGREVIQKHSNGGKSYPRSIIKDFSNANQNGRVHPTQKPVELMEYLIKTYTSEPCLDCGGDGFVRNEHWNTDCDIKECSCKGEKPAETVLDFTMGSGTAGVACKNLNRNFIGIELDENYFNIAKERIENH